MNSNNNLIERKKSKIKTTYTTGNPAYNIKQFNKHMGTDFNNPSTAEQQAQKAAQKAAKDIGTIFAQSPDGSNTISTSSSDLSGSSVGSDGGGGCAENLSRKYIKNKKIAEAKRYVRRYFIRPINEFCSNKTEILQSLIEHENTDCIIYTLNNLGDIKDTTKLTNKDIIYYYEDGILYDKNKVKVMDYDLYIKHEENRKKVDPNTVSNSILNDVYKDRLTDTMTESIMDSDFNEFNLDFDSYNAYGEKLVEGKPEIKYCCICGEQIIGYGNNAEPYKHGRCCDSCNLHYVLPRRLELLDNDENFQ